MLPIFVNLPLADGTQLYSVWDFKPGMAKLNEETEYALDIVCRVAGALAAGSSQQLHTRRVHPYSAGAGGSRAGYPVDFWTETGRLSEANVNEANGRFFKITKPGIPGENNG